MTGGEISGILPIVTPHRRYLAAQIEQERRKPLLLVEAKWADTEIDRSLRYLKTRFPESSARQIAATGRRDYVSSEGIRAAPASVFLAGLV